MKTACDIETATAESLLRLGYQRGLPSGISRSDHEQNREIWAEAECGDCGAQCLDVQPWRRGEQYVALATCKKCGHSEEV